MLKKRNIIIGLIISTLNTLLASDILLPKKQNVVIYDSNISLISEIRNVKLNQGDTDLVLFDIPTKIIEDSATVNIENTKIISKELFSNLISLDSLLDLNIGKEILINGKEVLLLAKNPIIVRTINGTISIIKNKSSVSFKEIPKTLTEKPYMLFEIIKQEKSSFKDLNIKYLTNGLSWKVNHILNIKDNKTLDFSSWVTLNNNSGKSLEDASVSISLNSNKYKINGKISLKDKSRKQFILYSASNINYKKLNILNLSNLNNELKEYYTNTFLKFKIEDDLADGNIKIYKENNFLGESKINNKNLLINAGKNKNIKVKIISIIEKKYKTNYKKKDEITIFNNSDEDTVIELDYNLVNNLKDTCIEPCSKIKLTDKNGKYLINLKKNSKYFFIRKYNINYQSVK